MKIIQKNKKRGFTLTEILVVVLIISVLAAIVYPMYTKAITKSRAVEAISLLEMVRNKQVQKYARDSQYYSEFASMGQLTSNSAGEQQLSGGAQLKIRDYTLSLNKDTNCMSAEYRKGSNSFTFSTSYETAGLGCSGNICTSFGDIVGDASSVCNCGSKTCANNFTLNPNTCECECFKTCKNGGCFDPYGGGESRPCSSGCGTEHSTSSCLGAIWASGSCSSPTKAPESQPCGNNGTQIRVCKPACNNKVDCSAWGVCIGQKCDDSKKPLLSQSCGNCNLGLQTRSVTCNSTTAEWNTPSIWTLCKGGGICAANETAVCGDGNGTKKCSASCGWGECVCKEGYKLEGGTCVLESKECDESKKPELAKPCAQCGTQTGIVDCDTSTGEWGTVIWGDACEDQGECESGASEQCGAGNTGNRTCNASCNWDVCEGSKTACPAKCPSGTVRDYKVLYEEDGECCKRECKAKPVYWYSGTPVGGGLFQTSCGAEPAGTESFCYREDFISTYKCYDSTNKPCTGCDLPKCADNSYFMANKRYCCTTAVGNRNECCQVVGMTFPAYCDRLPPGQSCSLSVAIYTCKNSLGNACQCPPGGGMTESTEDEDPNAGQEDITVPGLTATEGKIPWN